MNSPNAGTDSSILERHCFVAEATVSVFGSTCGIEIEPLSDDQDLTADGVIIAIISLVGDVNWSIFIGLPRETASVIAAKFAGFEIGFDSEDMGDAIGELTNILAGRTKAILDRRDIKAEISLPSVIRVDSLHVLVQQNLVVERMCFDSPLGKFWTGVLAHVDL